MRGCVSDGRFQREERPVLDHKDAVLLRAVGEIRLPKGLQPHQELNVARHDESSGQVGLQGRQRAFQYGHQVFLQHYNRYVGRDLGQVTLHHLSNACKRSEVSPRAEDAKRTVPLKKSEDKILQMWSLVTTCCRKRRVDKIRNADPENRSSRSARMYRICGTMILFWGESSRDEELTAADKDDVDAPVTTFNLEPVDAVT